MAARKLEAWCGEPSGGVIGWPANPADDGVLAEQVQCRRCRELAGLARPAFLGPWRLTGARWVRAISVSGRRDVVTVLMPAPLLSDAR